MVTSIQPQSTTGPTPPMVFVGRQPIFDRKKTVHAYELLYRTCPRINAYPGGDGDLATHHVIDSMMNVLSLDTLTSRKPAFINLTFGLLMDRMYTVLPKDKVVIELVETIEATPDVLEAVARLKSEGYVLALDDYDGHDGYQDLVRMADIVKVDFLKCRGDARDSILWQHRHDHLLFLAEKVETHQDFREALDLGYSLFQGYFFCKPEIVGSRDLPLFKGNYLQFVKELHLEPLNFTKLEGCIKREMTLSVRLLRYLNSSAVGMRHKIQSIRQALALLGESQLQKWASVLGMAGLAYDKPHELMTVSLVRARFCEQVGLKLDWREQELDLFLVGLFSCVDALLDQPMETILPSLGLPEDVQSTLAGENNDMAKIHRLMLAMEQGEEAIIEQQCADLNLNTEEVYEIYRQAIQWADVNLPT